jgi:3-oxoacyl-[acyl-carrier protein] reductase
MTDWLNKTVLITGGSRGIGAGVVEHFLNLGASVITTATTQEGVEAIAVKHKGARIFAYPLNLGQEESIQNFLTLLKDAQHNIEIIIHNAGMTDDQLSIQMSSARWHNVIQTNLSGTFLLTQGLLRPMIKARKGRIIMISSVVAFTGNPGQSAYCASKAGLIGLMKSLSLELASRSITVNAIAPGFIDTDMTSQLPAAQKEMLESKIPLKSLGLPCDIAYTCEFLANDRSRYITGQTLHVNGGLFIG